MRMGETHTSMITPPSSAKCRASHQSERNWGVYIVAIIIVIGLGLASRRHGALPFGQKELGDALWGAMVFLMIGLLFRRRRTLPVAEIALGFSIGIEFSQLYHAPWI